MPATVFTTPLQFTPFVAPDFGPLGCELTRAGRPYPVVIERYADSFHRDVLPKRAANEIQNAMSRIRSEHHTPFNLLMRSLQGDLLAYSCNYLVSHGASVKMDCTTTAKTQRDPDDTVTNVGLAFLLSRIVYMQDQHPASSRYQTRLYGFIPEVLNHYRRVCGLEPAIDLTGLALDDVSAAEGARLLQQAPIRLLPIRESGSG